MTTNGPAPEPHQTFNGECAENDLDASHNHHFERLIDGFERFRGQSVIVAPGSFDPVHENQIQMGVAAREVSACENLVFLAVARNPRKAEAVASQHDRVAMLLLATESIPNTYVVAQGGVPIVPLNEWRIHSRRNGIAKCGNRSSASGSSLKGLLSK